MNKKSEVNWLYIISIKEFQSYLELDLLKEISMVSKLMRGKLKPLLFKSLVLNLFSIKFDSNAISIAYDNQKLLSECDYTTLREEYNGDIEDSLNDFYIAINDIRKYTKCFHLDNNLNFWYYLYPLINIFDNLTDLQIRRCSIPYKAFINIGKTLPSLKMISFDCVYLTKSPTDIISSIDMFFPPNLTCLKIRELKVVTSFQLSYPYDYLFNRNFSSDYEDFTLPKISILSLKRLDYLCWSEQNHIVEDFILANPNLDSLLIRCYKLNISSSINSLKSLDIDDNISFNSIDQDFKLNSINTLAIFSL
ncbi:hypothetical protein CONCODRAFT_168190 [Conidiobolus coronatus NRRL 28638]|uniref:F-box domain-containing protein n=1 Tax=Conidiobolus coronatus (strain ATCC 28846 / CBS 209.66 / NRRL 28638) TaxID=796925 RepID=A0A137NV33_CONC2|nr:hypothetical protein CONCODRAFT_168190 [Conidiobolus coronatus NRRL 28638]|eukprot:KXN66675.1 hypothetical protein CONCODRAFT_168190 [Conidiobolus coronatus NRRL 28638]